MADLPPYAPLKLTAELKTTVNSALENGTPMLIAAVSAEGKPVLSFRGSIQVYSDTQLGFWLRGVGGNTVTAIQHNPQVGLMYRSPKTGAMFQFHGRARVATSEEERARVFETAPQAEQNLDPERTGLAIVIDLDTVEGFAAFGASGPEGFVRMARQ